MQLTVHLGEQSYPIEIERGILEKAFKVYCQDISERKNYGSV